MHSPGDASDSNPPSPRFQTTQWSVVLAAGGDQLTPEARAALESLCATYWYPLYAFVRREGHDTHAAEDLTQGFFLHLIQRQDFSRVRREKGRFRSFLLTALKHFLVNEREREQTQKRGGGNSFIPLDALLAEERLAAEAAIESSAEKTFDRRWAMAVLAQVVALLRDEYTATGRKELFETLKPYLSPEGPGRPQSEIAAALGLNENATKQAVFRLRERYRELLREQVTKTVPTPGDAEDELRHLIAALRG